MGANTQMRGIIKDIHIDTSTYISSLSASILPYDIVSLSSISKTDILPFKNYAAKGKRGPESAIAVSPTTVSFTIRNYDPKYRYYSDIINMRLADIKSRTMCIGDRHYLILYHIHSHFCHTVQFDIDETITDHLSAKNVEIEYHEYSADTNVNPHTSTSRCSCIIPYLLVDRIFRINLVDRITQICDSIPRAEFSICTCPTMITSIFPDVIPSSIDPVLNANTIDMVEIRLGSISFYFLAYSKSYNSSGRFVQSYFAFTPSLTSFFGCYPYKLVYVPTSTNLSLFMRISDPSRPDACYTFLPDEVDIDEDTFNLLSEFVRRVLAE